MKSATGSRAVDRLLASWAKPQPDGLARSLQPLAWIYGGLVALRRLAYRHGWMASIRAAVPVLVVGNWVAGGAGKTPAVIMLLPRLRALGFTPGVVSRGHGRRGGAAPAEVRHGSSADQVGDEPLLIHLRTGAPVLVGADRAAAAAALCRAHPAVDLIVTDDGLQHLRLARDAQLVIVDDRGAGNGLLLPAGPLREPVPSTLPFGSLVLYSSGQRSMSLPGHAATRRLGRILPLDLWRQNLFGPATGPSGQAAARVDPGLRGRRVLAVAGLARPEGFFRMLEAVGLDVDRLPLPDHARFDPLPWPATTTDVVITEKDAVKLRPEAAGTTRIWVATLDFDPEAGFDAALRDLCEALLRPKTLPTLPESPP